MPRNILDERTATLCDAWGRLLRKDGMKGDPEALESFIKGGAHALAIRRAGAQWVQISVSYPDIAALRSLFASLARLSVTWIDQGRIANMFFMRKAPGLRIRFEAAGDPAALQRHIDDLALDWRQRGLISDHAFGQYEPEAQLFGGPRSMAHVHSLFTLDSLAWLNWCAEDHPATETWCVSFALLRAVLDGLEISGWEDLGIWAHIVEEIGRKLPEGILSASEEDALAGPLIEWWADAAGWGQTGFAESVLKGISDGLVTGAARWRAGYFQRDDCWIGARQAAAYFTIFHWNRAGLSPAQQALIANTLAYRRVRDEREPAA